MVDLKKFIPIERLDTLFTEIDGRAIFLVSLLEGRYLYLSEAMRDIDGHDPKLHMGTGFDATFSFIHPDDYHYCMEHFMTQMNKVMALEDTENFNISGTNTYRIKHADGHYVWAINSHVLLNIIDGKPDLLLGYYKKVDEEKKREVFLLNQLKKEMAPERFSKMMDEYISLAKDYNPRVLDVPQLQELLQVPFSNKHVVKLTSREKEILKLISEGLSDKQISNILHISNFTAKTHRKNILEKYGVKNTAELIKAASKSFWL